MSAGWRWRAGPAFAQGFSAGVRQRFQPLLLAGVALRGGPSLAGETKLVLTPPWAVTKLCPPWRPRERPSPSAALVNTRGNGDSPVPCCAVLFNDS